MNNTTGVSSGAGSARLSSTLEFTFYCQWSSCCLMFRVLSRASFSVPFYLAIILSVTYMCVSGIDFAYIWFVWLFIMIIRFSDCILRLFCCCFLFVILLIFSITPSVSPGWIGWTNFFLNVNYTKIRIFTMLLLKKSFKIPKG